MTAADKDPEVIGTQNGKPQPLEVTMRQVARMVQLTFRLAHTLRREGVLEERAEVVAQEIIQDLWIATFNYADEMEVKT